jgi:hypothetical protein
MDNTDKVPNGDYSFHKKLLLGKFAEIQSRTWAACEQLEEEALNWRPTAESNSIANLIVHIGGNVRERIGQGMLGMPFDRDREAEFAVLPFLSAEALREQWSGAFSLLTGALREAAPELLAGMQTVRGKQRQNLEIFHQCAAHFSEHMGQILYIAKMRQGERYVSTSLPRVPRG